MTPNEKKAAAELIKTIRTMRAGLECSAAINPDKMTDDDLTFAMGQAQLVVERFTVALAVCRARHTLIK